MIELKSLVINTPTRNHMLGFYFPVLLVVGLWGGSVFGATAMGLLPSTSNFAILTTDCHTTDHIRPLTPAPTTVVAGTSGTILFNCSGDAAFTVTNPGLATPQFMFSNGYTAVTILVHIPGATTCSPGQPLVSGQSFTFARFQRFDYCAIYSNAPASGLGSFDLAWTRSANQ